MKTATARRHRIRLGRVLAYIEAHPGEPLGIDTLSAVAAFSKFHFHRQSAVLLGMGIRSYVRLGRLKRASYRLAFRTGDPITDIALDCGYAAPESFSRAFRERVGQTPSDFRRQPDWPAWRAAFQPVGGWETEPMEPRFHPCDVGIIDVADTRVALLEHRGDPALIGDSVRRFIAWRKLAGLPPRRSATFNIWYSDPDTTPPAEFRLGLCAATQGAIGANSFGVVASVIPAGRCAVLRSVGGDAALRRAARFLHSEWLPGSGRAVRDFPPYCQRITLVPDVAEHEAITDLFLPIE